ncbi:alpha/beta hydrolase [Pseudonocardia sp. WMMC193]|uniref:alpha/beta hydrolase n=1 Tax=Pseudonocardia sp. WMMC193 TaxID=2911965 RepID=UPI001F2B953F|nr:alpha/beta hydrolase [Pseudonocardia sp. WMMC193]MCF7551497.1 alpha/beta hydrolase [Pseudonocardia sp. WMMC193]
MASAESAELRTIYQSWSDRMAAAPDMDLPTLRDLFEEWHLPTAEPTGVTYEEVDAGGRPALWCLPLDAADDRVLLYLHGGGFVVGSIATHRKLAGHLAKAVGARALVLDYRLAPEHPFPAQVQDAVAAYRWLLAQGYAPEHIATAGDSAGGNLAISTVLALRAEGVPLPAAILPMSPWLDMEHVGKTLEANADTDALVQRSVVEAMSGMFLGEDGDRRDPLANPLHCDPTGLPPCYIAAGGHETLLDNAELFHEKARAAGVDATLEITPEMQHVHPFSAGRAPEADATIAAMAAWVRPRLGLEAR